MPLEQSLENNPDLFTMNRYGIHLQEDGKKFSDSVLKEMKPTNRKQLLDTIHFIRSVYDRLTDDEFMFLIYMTYDYTEKSDRFTDLLKRRKQLAESLERKKIITHQRYLELVKG